MAECTHMLCSGMLWRGSTPPPGLKTPGAKRTRHGRPESFAGKSRLRLRRSCWRTKGAPRQEGQEEGQPQQTGIGEGHKQQRERCQQAAAAAARVGGVHMDRRRPRPLPRLVHG